MLARSRNPFRVSPAIAQEAACAWGNLDADRAARDLKGRLAELGTSIPVLYKHYVDLCEVEGVRFLDFGTDPAFGNCVDGLARLDLHFLKSGKRARYLDANS